MILFLICFIDDVGNFDLKKKKNKSQIYYNQTLRVTNKVTIEEYKAPIDVENNNR